MCGQVTESNPQPLNLEEFEPLIFDLGEIKYQHFCCGGGGMLTIACHSFHKFQLILYTKLPKMHTFIYISLYCTFTLQYV